MKTVSLLICCILFSTYAIAQTGYSRIPWGSQTWGNSGKHPHQHQPQPEKHVEKKQTEEKKKITAKHKKPWIHHNHLHRHTKKKYILVKEDDHDHYKPIVRQKTIVRTRYVPIVRKTSVNLCSGDTVYLRDKNTGEITIRYVSAAQSCR